MNRRRSECQPLPKSPTVRLLIQSIRRRPVARAVSPTVARLDVEIALSEASLAHARRLDQNCSDPAFRDADGDAPRGRTLTDEVYDCSPFNQLAGS